MTGAWILIDKKKNEHSLYTREAVDVIIELDTNIEYTRGPWKLFPEDNLPALVENDPGHFQLLNKIGKHLVGYTATDCLKEIMIAQNLPK